MSDIRNWFSPVKDGIQKPTTVSKEPKPKPEGN